MKRVHESRSDETDIIGAGAPESEIEITPAMIEAGADVIWCAFSDVIVYGSGTGREVAVSVFQAMERRRSS
jgi:hypothetical protein